MALKKAPSKLCIECAEGIPPAASKCAKCGAYQDWRRHVSFGQSSLALLISLIALASTLVLASQSITTQVQSAFFPQTRLQFGIADISPAVASLVVTNPTDRPVILNGLSCTMWIPMGEEWLARGKWGLIEDVWPTKAETMGAFLVSYEPSEPIWLPSGQQEAFRAEVTHISPPRLPVGPNDDDALAQAGCFLSGMNDMNDLVAGGAMLAPSDLILFDALDMVVAADYSPAQEEQRTADKARIANYPISETTE